MEEFTLIIHTGDPKSVVKKIPLVRHLPSGFLEKAISYLSPLQVSGLKTSSFKEELKGEIICCPYTEKMLSQLPFEQVMAKIIASIHVAHKRGSKLIGLGEVLSYLTNNGELVAKNSSVPVTTGKSYIIYSALACAKKVIQQRGIPWQKAEIVIIGAKTYLGAVCARLLAYETCNLTLIAPMQNELELLASKLMYETGVVVKVTNRLKEALGRADVVILLAEIPGLNPVYLKSKTVMCDITFPRSVSWEVFKKRRDILIIHEGLIRIPGGLTLEYPLGYPPGILGASLVEPIVLMQKKRVENYSLGENITVSKVKEIGSFAKDLGYSLTGWITPTGPVMLKEKPPRILKGA